MSQNPYKNLDARAYWKTGVAEQHPLEPVDIYRKKFDISATDRVATAGSCFAQHIAREMRGSGFTVLDVEPAPRGTPTEIAQKFGFQLYSARYGNIYTTRQLVQLAQEALEGSRRKEIVWTKGAKFMDALRPSVEPDGLPTEDHVLLQRKNHIRHVRKLFQSADVFIFTLGLTETWQHSETGTVFPTASGTIATAPEPSSIGFKNLSFTESLDDLRLFRSMMKSVNANMRFIFTVSPVPLTATASGNHVLPATMLSKSILRAVAGQMEADYDDVDYFPSYEIVAGHPSRGFYFDANLRTVNRNGVEVVMRSFFNVHNVPTIAKAKAAGASSASRIVCEEQLQEAFAP